MNSDTGEIKNFKPFEQLKPPWIPCGQPNPDCKTCGGKGSVLVDLTKDLNFGNRADRRKIPKGYTRKYLPCPDCAGKKMEAKE